MKKLVVVGVVLVGVATMLMALPAGRTPLNVAVTPVEHIVLPGTFQTGGVAWASATVYAQDAVAYTNNRWYLAMNAGTSDTGPVHLDGDASDNGIMWRYVHPRRTGFVIQNLGTGTVFLAYGNSAVTNKGIALLGNSGANMQAGGDCFQGDIHAVCFPGNTNLLSIHQE